MKTPKAFGFTLIEMALVIGILAILVSIGAPDFLRTKHKQTFHAQSRLLFETIADARANAMAGKECPGGAASNYWQVAITSAPDTKLGYKLQCDTNDVQTLPDSDLPDESVQIKDISITTPKIRFLNETAQTVLLNGTDHEQSLNLTLFHPESSAEHTICIKRAAGFPEFDQTC